MRDQIKEKTNEKLLKWRQTGCLVFFYVRSIYNPSVNPKLINTAYPEIWIPLYAIFCKPPPPKNPTYNKTKQTKNNKPKIIGSTGSIFSWIIKNCELHSRTQFTFQLRKNPNIINKSWPLHHMLTVVVVYHQQMTLKIWGPKYEW